MKKFTVTRLSELDPGDRFYFPSKRDRLCTFIKKNINKISGYLTTYDYKDDKGSVYLNDKNKKVVFLRNIND